MLDALERPAVAQVGHPWVPRYVEPEQQQRSRDRYFVPETYDPALGVRQPAPRIRWYDDPAASGSAWGTHSGGRSQYGTPYLEPHSPWSLEHRSSGPGSWGPESRSSRPGDDYLPQSWPRRSEVWREYPQPDLHSRFPPANHHDRLQNPGFTDGGRSEWGASGSSRHPETRITEPGHSWLDQPFVWPDFLLLPPAMPGGVNAYPGSAGGWIPGL